MWWKHTHWQSLHVPNLWSLIFCNLLTLTTSMNQIYSFWTYALHVDEQCHAKISLKSYVVVMIYCDVPGPPRAAKLSYLSYFWTTIQNVLLLALNTKMSSAQEFLARAFVCRPCDNIYKAWLALALPNLLLVYCGIWNQTYCNATIWPIVKYNSIVSVTPKWRLGWAGVSILLV